jgi:signal peptidase I
MNKDAIPASSEPTNERHLDNVLAPLKLRRLLTTAMREVLTTLLPALLGVLVINVYIAEAARVESGPSMQPNLYVGYRVVTEKISYRLHPPERGDIVVVERDAPQKALIKRVMALPGEWVAVRDGHTFINGQPVDEPWVTHFGGQDAGPLLVPEGHVFIVGDNRTVSHDSRAIGPVRIDQIMGRVWLIYWPLEEMQLVP